MERELTKEENAILKVIQDMYGNQNSVQDVFFTDNEACISITNSSGQAVMFASVSNLSNWLASGDINSEQELRQKWLSR